MRAALRDPGVVDPWFSGEDFQQPQGWFRTHLVDALLRRTTTFEEIAEEAAAAVAHPYAGRIGYAQMLARRGN